MIQKTLIILFSGIHFLIFGQGPTVPNDNISLPHENVELITDRDIYLSGETIWFRADIYLDEKQESISQILYIELFNADQKSILQKKYRITNGLTLGAIDIPIEFLSNTYYIRAYTYYNKNFPVDKFFYTAVQIINPRLSLPASSSKLSNESVSFHENNFVNDSTSFYIDTKPTNDGKKIVTIRPNGEIQNINNEPFTFELLNNRQEQLFSSEFTLSENSVPIFLPYSFANNSGLYFIVIKDAENNIAKIHAFIEQSQENQALEFKTDKTIYAIREEVNIHLSEVSKLNENILGISVARKGTVLPTIEKLNLFIQDPLLLFSYLKTHSIAPQLSAVESENFLQTLNSKLNTNKFKNYFITLNINLLKWIPEIRDVSLSGIVIDKHTRKPLVNIPIYLSVFKNDPQIHIYNSLENGSFLFSLNNYESVKDVFLCPLFEKDNDIELKVNLDFSNDFPDLKAIPLSIDSSDFNLLEQMWIATQTSLLFKTNPKSQSTGISLLPYSFENPEVSTILDDYIGTPTLEMVFKELVPSVRVKKNKENYSLAVFDSDRDISYNNPLILVDNIPVFNVNELLKIDPKLIEKIEVQKAPFILGSNTINGIIMISTLTDNFGGIIMPNSSTFFDYQTASPNFYFKAKTYSSEEDLNSRNGDFRTLLHWDPFFSIKADSKINFYTSDQTGEYEAYIFAKTKSGQAIQSKPLNFQVKN